jgi:hypothetical protein
VAWRVATYEDAVRKGEPLRGLCATKESGEDAAEDGLDERLERGEQRRLCDGLARAQLLESPDGGAASKEEDERREGATDESGEALEWPR